MNWEKFFISLKGNTYCEELTIDSDDGESIEEIENGLQEFSKFLATNTKIKKLTIDISQVSNKGMKFIFDSLASNQTIKRFELARRLVLSVFHLAGSKKELIQDLDAMDSFANNKSITYLSIDYGCFVGQGVLAVYRCLNKKKNLKRLKLSDIPPISFEMKPLFREALSSCLVTLKELDIKASEFEEDEANDIFLALGKSPNLESLDLSSCVIKGKPQEMTKFFLNNTTLQSVNLERINVDTGQLEDTIEAILKNEKTNTTSLKLTKHNRLSMNAISLMMRLVDKKRIGELHLNGPTLNSENFGVICERLKNNCCLESILFTSCGLDESCAMTLFQSLLLNTTLRKLGCSYNDFNLEDKKLGKKVASILKHNYRMEEISHDRAWYPSDYLECESKQLCVILKRNIQFIKCEERNDKTFVGHPLISRKFPDIEISFGNTEKIKESPNSIKRQKKGVKVLTHG